MASSSYCDFVITLKNGEEICWIGEDGFSPFFQVPKNAKKKLLSIASIEELKDFILECASVYEDPEIAKDLYNDYCKDFDDSINKIKNFEDIKSLSLAWGEFDPDEGFPPEEFSEGESIDYDFETQNCKKKTTPRKDFIKEMYEIYGDMFEEDDMF